EALGWLAAGALDLRALELRRHGADDALGHLVLKLENILQRPVEPVRPDMPSGGRIDELRRDGHPVRRLAHAAFEQVADPELATDLPYVHGMTLVGEARVAGDHEQVAKARQRRDDIFAMPSAKYSCSGSPLRFWNGRTAIESLSGSANTGRG